MRISPNQFVLAKKVLFWLTSIMLVYSFMELSRLGLPDISNPGHKDNNSIALYMLAFLFLCSLLPGYLSGLFVGSVILILCVFSISNWWFYDFYRDFITPDTLKLAIYAEETALSWEGLKYKQEAAKFVLIMLVWTLLYLGLRKFKPDYRITLIWVGIFSLLGYQQQTDYQSRSVGGLRHKAINHVGYFFRELTPQKPMQIDDALFAKIGRALPGRKLGLVDRQYPMFQAGNTSSDVIRKKNVLLIVLESVRASETALYGPNDRSVTPYLDSFARESVNFSQFYANSSQTVRSEVALLCSALDYINGAPFSMGGTKIKTNCLPSIMASNGYQTHWIHGYKKNFFNREVFFPKLGFENIHDIEVISQNRDVAMLGWGIADVDLFDYAIETLEKSRKPFFAEVLTLSNHYPYLWDWGISFPQSLQLTEVLNEAEDNLYPAYRRGIYYTDYALGKFIERFKQSPLYDETLLIITADHGIWTFPDALLNRKGHQGEMVRNEIYFRLPMLIHAPDLGNAIINTPVSQIDLAPTVLEYLGINAANAFLGTPMLDRRLSKDNPVYFLTSGSFGVRRGNQYCYPVDTSGVCDDAYGKAYRNCNKKSNNIHETTFCFNIEGDIIAGESNFLPVEVDQSNDRALIDYSQYQLLYGHMPNDELL